MKPLLEAHGGGFRYDFKVSEVLKNEKNQPINRVFVIYFQSEEKSKEFFCHEDYLIIKKNYFEASVESTTIISKYNYSTTH